MGQAPAGTRFVARTRGCAVQIEPRGATLHLAPAAQPHADESSRGPRPRLARRHAEPTRSGSGSVLRMALVDSAPQPAVSGSQQLPGHVNYLLGRDRSGWKTGVRTFAQVRCDQVYPGIDLAYYGNGSELEYDFIVGAGAEPANIRMRMSGAEELKVDAAGDLLIRTEAGTLRQQRPTAYQEAEGGRRTVQASYRVAGDTVAFELGDFDRSRALVIDPLLNYSTYLGGNGADAGNAAAADASGNAYLTGTTASLDFPTSAAAQGAKLGTTDAFVSKLNPAGNALIYSTYLGGAASESGLGIVVDVNDGATITGETTSANFPVTSGPAYGGNSDAFVTRLDGSGAPVFSTLVGGSDTDIGNGVAVDGSQNAYVVGTTSSSNLRGATPAAFGGESDAFVTKLNSAGVLQYTRFVGGNDFDAGFGIGVSPGGEAIIAGDTFSPNFPRVGALQNARNGEADGFVSRLNAGGSALQYSTYLGGSDYDRALAVAVDSDGNAYVTGTTYSSNFP
ncbi:MAG: hypothetical protein K0Q72_4764, partial [Armatimonadetes bacterium]|nr:hypothetical protein [Armatimonadota bacterium]